MRTRSIVATVGIVALVACVAAVASAQKDPGQMPMRGPDGGMGPGMHGGFGLLGLPLRDVTLTQEQQDKIKAIVDEARPAIQALRQQVREAEQAFRAAHPLTDFDENAIREHIAAQAKLQADIEVALARARTQAAALLTPEQLKTVQETQARMQEHMQERMERRGPHGPGAPAPAPQ